MLNFQATVEFKNVQDSWIADARRGKRYWRSSRCGTGSVDKPLPGRRYPTRSQAEKLQAVRQTSALDRYQPDAGIFRCQSFTGDVARSRSLQLIPAQPAAVSPHTTPGKRREHTDASPAPTPTTVRPSILPLQMRICRPLAQYILGEDGNATDYGNGCAPGRTVLQYQHHADARLDTGSTRYLHRAFRRSSAACWPAPSVKNYRFWEPQKSCIAPRPAGQQAADWSDERWQLNMLGELPRHKLDFIAHPALETQTLHKCGHSPPSLSRKTDTGLCRQLRHCYGAGVLPAGPTRWRRCWHWPPLSRRQRSQTPPFPLPSPPRYGHGTRYRRTGNRHRGTPCHLRGCQQQRELFHAHPDSPALKRPLYGLTDQAAAQKNKPPTSGGFVCGHAPKGATGN